MAGPERRAGARGGTGDAGAKSAGTRGRAASTSLDTLKGAASASPLRGTPGPSVLAVPQPGTRLRSQPSRRRVSRALNTCPRDLARRSRRRPACWGAHSEAAGGRNGPGEAPEVTHFSPVPQGGQGVPAGLGDQPALPRPCPRPAPPSPPAALGLGTHDL